MVEAVVTASMLEVIGGMQSVIFEAMINKLNIADQSVQRLLCLTQKFVILFEGQKLVRKQKVVNLSAIIRSSQSNEMLLIFPSTKDLRFTGLEAERVHQLMVLIQE